MSDARRLGTEEYARGLDRISSLTDGVFAIAITLLVLNIRAPQVPPDLVAQELPSRLLDLGPKYLSYVLSFVVIFLYWVAHHGIFRTIKRYDRVLIWLNGLFLMCIAFLPFPTSLLGEYGNQPLVAAIYAGSVAVARLPLTALWWYATGKRRHVDADLDLHAIRTHRTLGLVIPLVFLLSIGVAFLSVRAAYSVWTLFVVVELIFLYLERRRYRRQPK
jgi:uncharacterized membrane protein